MGINEIKEAGLNKHVRVMNGMPRIAEKLKIGRSKNVGRPKPIW